MTGLKLINVRNTSKQIRLHARTHCGQASSSVIVGRHGSNGDSSKSFQQFAPKQLVLQHSGRTIESPRESPRQTGKYVCYRPRTYNQNQYTVLVVNQNNYADITTTEVHRCDNELHKNMPVARNHKQQQTIRRKPKCRLGLTDSWHAAAACSSM